MILVGLTGGIGHGKTTLAQFLAMQAGKHQQWESSDIIIEVANALRHEQPVHPRSENVAGINAWLAPLADIITTCVHCPADFTQIALTAERIKKHPENYAKLFEYLRLMHSEPELQLQEITPINKQLFRSLLQWLGGYLVITVGDGIWIDELIRRIRREAGSGTELVTVSGLRYPADAERLRNAGGFVVAVNRPGIDEADARDITERNRDSIKPDIIVINNGTLSQLKACADRLYSDLVIREQADRYTAA